MENTKRKTLDQILGINGLAIVAVVSHFLFPNTIISSIGFVSGVSAIYYLIKKKEKLTKKQKQTGWSLIVLWLIIFGNIVRLNM